MRWFVAAICVAGALLLSGASMLMNWLFWTGQGADVSTARVLGIVSIGFDGFKSCLPLVIGWAAVERFRLGYVIGTLFFCGCLLFSFVGAIGFATSSRGVVTGNREAISLRYAAAEQEQREIKDQSVALGAVRPLAVLEEAIGRAKQDRRWSKRA